MRRSTILAITVLLSTAACLAANGQQPGRLVPIDSGATIPKDAGTLPANVGTVPEGVADGYARFDATLRAFARTLAETPAYEARLETAWESEQPGTTASGVIASRLVVQNPNWLSLTLQAQGPAGVSYRIVANGSQILREMGARKAYSLTPAAGDPRLAIESDGTTLAVLRSAGAEYLLRRDLHGALAAQVLRAAEGPIVERDGERLQLWSLTLADGAQVELLFTTGDRVVPVERKSVLTVPLAGGDALAMRTSTRLVWNFDVRPAPETFSTAPTPGFERVFDLSGNAAATGDRLEGHAAPATAWRAMDGSPVSLGDSKGRTPVVLLFWATWAAPSTEAMPALHNYAQEFTQKGVRIVALNVGEPADQAEAFAKKVGYSGELGLDSRAETMAAFGLESTPSVVLIDRQGIVRGVWQGVDGDARKKIFEATVAMLQEQAAAQGR